MQFRFTFFLLLALLFIVGCNRDDIDVPTTTQGQLPPTDSLTATTSLAGTVKKPDGSIPENAIAEVLYGDFVIHAQQVNAGDGTWFFNDIAVSDDPNVLVRISAPGWVPAIRSIPNRSDAVRYSNVVLLDRGQVDPVNQTVDYTATNGLLSATIPANGYEPYPANIGISISLNEYTPDEIENLNDAIAAPLLVNDAGTIRTLSNPTIYALVVTAGQSTRVDFNKSLDRGITLSTVNAGPTSIIYVLNQETGYWENISTPDGMLEVKQFGYFAVAQASNSVRVSGRIEQPDGTPIVGGSVYALVTDVAGERAFDVSATDGNGDYELQIPEGSSGTVYLNPQACGEEEYVITQQTTDLDLGVFSIDIGTSTLIQGVVDGCTAGTRSSQDLAVSVSSGSFPTVIVPVASDGSFSLAADVCSQQSITLVPIVQSGPGAGRRGGQLVARGGDPLDNLTLSYCDSTVVNELIFISFGQTTSFSTTPSASFIHSDTIEIVETDNRWLFALSSEKVFITFENANEQFVSNDFADVTDFLFDGTELRFSFEDVAGTRTDFLNGGATQTIESLGGVTVKVD